MKKFPHNLFVLILLGPLTLVSIAAEQDSSLTIAQEHLSLAAVYRDEKIVFSSFGAGMAEGFRANEKPSKVSEQEYAVHWSQARPGYSIEWVAAKKQPNTTTPVSMKLTQVGTILPGKIIIGKSASAEVTRLLGKPDTMERSRIIYFLPNHLGDDVAIFSFSKGVLTEIEWQWFNE